jgi:hypothetical protein
MDMLPTALKRALGMKEASTAAEPLAGMQNKENSVSCYIKTKIRSIARTQKGVPRQAISYLTDDHYSKRIASCSKEEIDYITRVNTGYKSYSKTGECH